MKRTLLLLSLLLTVGLLAAQMQSATLRVYFPTAKFDLNAATKLRLDSLADSLALHQRYEIALRGHTDSQGDSLANILLSEKRSTSVSAYLTGKSLRIRDVRSVGQREPLNAAKTPEAMARNRRVDILVRYWPKPKVVPMPDPPIPVVAEIEDNTTIEDLLKKLRKPDQVYCINPSRDTILACAEGAVLHFKAGSFKQSPTCPDACVTIRVREDYKQSDQILDHLNTMSNKQLLESSGMIYTRAEDCAGKPIAFLPGKEMQVFLPADGQLTTEQLFDGHRVGADSIMNWHGAVPARTLTQVGLKDFWCGGGVMGGGSRVGGGKKCPFFFCRIKLFFQKIFGSKQKKDAAKARTSLRKRMRKPPKGCSKLDDFCAENGIADPVALQAALGGEFAQSLGYSDFMDMVAKMDPIKLDALVANYRNTELQNPELRFNYYSTPQMGWSNIDKYMKYPPSLVTEVIVDVQPDLHTICEMVFKRDHILAEAESTDDGYEFYSLPKQEPAVLLVMRYYGGKAYLAMQEIKIEPGPYKVELKEVSLEELNTALRKLNY
jgi:OmpA family